MSNVDVVQFLPSYLVPFFADGNLSLFLTMFTSLLIGTAVLSVLVKLIRLRITVSKKYVLLEVKPVYKTLQSPLSTQQLFKMLHSLDKHASLTERLFHVKQVISCELVSDKEKGIRYIMRVPVGNVSLIRKTLLSYLPGIEVKETTDYLPASFADLPNNNHLIVRELKLSKPFPLPLDRQAVLNQL